MPLINNIAAFTATSLGDAETAASPQEVLALIEQLEAEIAALTTDNEQVMNLLTKLKLCLCAAERSHKVEGSYKEVLDTLLLQLLQGIPS